jgi:hypothetical protein
MVVQKETIVFRNTVGWSSDVIIIMPLNGNEIANLAINARIVITIGSSK